MRVIIKIGAWSEYIPTHYKLNIYVNGGVFFVRIRRVQRRRGKRTFDVSDFFFSYITNDCLCNAWQQKRHRFCEFRSICHLDSVIWNSMLRFLCRLIPKKRKEKKNWNIEPLIALRVCALFILYDFFFLLSLFAPGRALALLHDTHMSSWVGTRSMCSYAHWLRFCTQFYVLNEKRFDKFI